MEIRFWASTQGLNSGTKTQLVFRAVSNERVLCRWKYIDIRLSHLTHSEVPLAFINLVSETSVWLDPLPSDWGHRWHWNIRWHEHTIANHDDCVSMQFTVPRDDLGTQGCSSPAAQRTIESHDKLLQEHATQDTAWKRGKTRIPFSYLEILDYNQCNDCPPALTWIKCRTELPAKGRGSFFPAVF